MKSTFQFPIYIALQVQLMVELLLRISYTNRRNRRFVAFRIVLNKAWIVLSIQNLLLRNVNQRARLHRNEFERYVHR